MLTQMPETAKAYCPDCGAQTVNSCPKCNHAIRGSSTEVLHFGYTPPKYCENCGEPYPWTAQAIEAGQELAEVLDGLTDTEKSELTKNIADLASDTPKTPLASARVKRILAKLGADAYQVAIKVVTDVATESAKKQLGL